MRLCTELKLGGAIASVNSPLSCLTLSFFISILILVAACFLFPEAARKGWITPDVGEWLQLSAYSFGFSERGNLLQVDAFRLLGLLHCLKRYRAGVKRDRELRALSRARGDRPKVALNPYLSLSLL